MKKVLIGTLAIFVSVIVMADTPTISGVMVQQRWPWSRLVDIDYVLICDSGQLMDITVEAYDGLDLLTLPQDSLSGDLSGVRRGVRRIVWDPTMTPYANNGLLPEFRVALTPTQAPLYVILDLTKSVGDAGQSEYVYESALTNGLWGAWVRNPVTNEGSVVESVVWTGVTTSDIYKTDKLVLRRISKGTFKMGSEPPTIFTTLTKDFYAGVFEVTQRQWELISDKPNPSYYDNSDYYMTRPVENVSYNNIRGTAELGGGGWPTNSDVYGESFVGLLRTRTGLAGFDLPTEAQWEYACRAGTTTYYNDGGDASLDVLGRYAGNGGLLADGTTYPEHDCGPTNGTAIVGSYLPNAWGLYDMHGNVFEWCLDWFADLQGGKDPLGVESALERVRRGGGWAYSMSICRSSYRASRPFSRTEYHLGFRLVITLP
ncbi:MAG: formylglycine-generating enzyme family protein [Kiritimatiellia bacterium]